MLAGDYGSLTRRQGALDGVGAGVPDLGLLSATQCFGWRVVRSDTEKLCRLLQTIRPELNTHLREILIAGNLISGIDSNAAVHFAWTAIVEDNVCAWRGVITTTTAGKLRALLAREKVRATHDLGDKLGVPRGADLVRIDRLRLADGIPYVLERQYYDHARFGRLLEIDIQGSLYQLLTREFAVDLHRSQQTLRAVRPPRPVAHKLQISTDVPCMFLESLTSDPHGRCLEVLQAYYRGDRYTFRVESGRYADEPTLGRTP